MTTPGDAIGLAEKALLGCFLSDNALREHIANVSNDDFSLDSHRRIHSHMARMAEAGRPIDLITLTLELSDLNQLESCGGPGYLGSLIEGVIPENFAAYNRAVRMAAKERRTNRLIQSMAETCKVRSSEKWGSLRLQLQQLEGVLSHDDSDQVASRPGKPAAHKVANWKTCAEVKPEMLVFLWPQRIPLKFGTAFLGDPDMGKSLVALDFMARLSRGKRFLDGAENLHGVVESILLSTEDDPNTIIVPRLMAAGADLSKIHLVDTVRMFDAEQALEEERQLTLESDLSVIREKLEANPAIKLLVIDPISNYLGSKNLMKEQEIRSVLMPVVTMAQELSVAVIVVMHHSKAEGRSAMHKAIGAVGAVGSLRMAWSFMKSPDDETTREMLQSKKNLGRFPGLRFTTESVKVTIDQDVTEQAVVKYVGVSNVSIETVLATQEDKEARQERPAIAFLKENLPKDGTHHSVPLIDKAQEKGISRATLFRARTSLGINTEKIGGQWFWSWPGDN